MNKYCAVVKDLAPLYVEKLTGELTNQFIEEHLADCEACRNEIESLRLPTPLPSSEDPTPLKRVSRYLQRRQCMTIMLTALIVSILLILIGGFMTTPEYLPAQEAIINTNYSTSGNRIQIIFSERVSDYHLEGPYEQNGQDVYHVTAWTTPWQQLFGSGMRNRSLWIEYASHQHPIICYNANDGTEMVSLLGSYSGGVIPLPRFTLHYYAWIAAGVALLTTVLYFPLRKNHRQLWLRLLLIPVCYLMAHLAISFISPDSYSIARSFCLILLLAFFLYGTMNLVMIRHRKKSL